MRRHRRVLMALGLALTMIAGACGSDGGSGSAPETTKAASTTTAAPTTTKAVQAPASTTTTTAAPATTTTMAPGEYLGDGSLGTVEVGPGEAIQIRSLNAISGDVAFLGIPNENGIRMAVEDYGQIDGHDVEVGTGMDDLCSADGGQAAAQIIVADEDVIGVIGTSCSGAATAASPLISEAGMVMVSGSNTSPSLTSDLAGTAGPNYHAGYFRTAHNDLYQGQAAANFALQVLGVSSAAAIHDGDPYTEGLARAFADAFEAGGGTLTGFTAVNKGDTDMVPVLTEVAAGGPELLFFPIFQPEGDFIIQQSETVAGLEGTVMMAADGLLNSNYLALAETEGMYFSGPDVRYGENFNQSTGETAADVLADYEAEFGEAPAAPFWAHSYDAAVLLLDAIDAASYDQDGTLVIDRAGVREHLHSVSNYSGLIGSMSCDDFGDCSSAKITVIQNTDSTDYAASTANVVYEYAPLAGGEQVGDIEAIVQPKSGGTFILATTQGGAHVNHGMQSGVGIGLPSSKVFAALVTLDSTWTPQPYLATDWNISDDGLTATFNLVEGATFHDGEPITSEDVAFSIQAVQANHPFKPMLAPITGFDTSDPHTIVLTLDHPHPALLTAVSDVLLPIMPKHIFDDGTPIGELRDHPRNHTDVVGSGPFTLTEFVSGERIHLTKYDDFFIPGRPYLDEIIINVVADENSALLGLENGEIDAYGFANPLNAQRVAENADLVLDNDHAFGVGPTNELQFNLNSEALSDLRVRQAIALAIDRDFVTGTLHMGQTREQLTSIHPDSPWYNADVERYDVDLDRARELLAEAGHADGLELSITYIPGPDAHQKNVAEYIAQAVDEIGITVTVNQPADIGSWAGMFYAPDPEPWDMTMNAYFNWGDPVIGVHRIYMCDNAVKGHFVNNSEYCNERVDELLLSAAQSNDFDERKAAYDEFQEITSEEVPLYYINTLPIYLGRHPDVINVPDGPWGFMTSMMDTWLDR